MRYIDRIEWEMWSVLFDIEICTRCYDIQEAIDSDWGLRESGRN